MSMTSLSYQQLRQAADLKEQIEGLEKQLDQVLGGVAADPAATAAPAFSQAIETPTDGTKRRRKMSAQARANIRAAQKARRAAERGETVSPVEHEAKETPAEEKPAKQRRKKRKVTAAVLRGLAKAREARKAKAKAAKDDMPF